MLLGAIAVFAVLETRPIPPRGTTTPFAKIYHDPLSKLDVMMLGGDGHAFAVIAQDPTLSRPNVLSVPQEFSYRAQRPIWGYLAWAGSLGQARLTSWVLLMLTILSCGTACATAGYLLRQRGASAWWALVVPFLAFETLSEATPELLSFTLVGIGVVLWQRRRTTGAVVVLTLAALSRETMLLAVAALGLWSLAHLIGPVTQRVRATLPLLVPFATYLGWICFLRLRLGYWPFNRSGERLSLPGAGLAQALSGHADAGVISFWIAVGFALCAGTVALARDDVLTWIAVTFAAFALLLGEDVWLTNAGFQRALLPLFAFGAIATIGGVARRRAANHMDADLASVDAEQRGEEAPGVALGGLGHVLGGALHQHPSPAVAALGTEVDDPVG
jgi:hypothetical protein